LVSVVIFINIASFNDYKINYWLVIADKHCDLSLF